MVVYIQCTAKDCRAIGTRLDKMNAETSRCQRCGSQVKKIASGQYDHHMRRNSPPLERPETYQEAFVEARKGFPAPLGQQPITD